MSEFEPSLQCDSVPFIKQFVSQVLDGLYLVCSKCWLLVFPSLGWPRIGKAFCLTFWITVSWLGSQKLGGKQISYNASENMNCCSQFYLTKIWPKIQKWAVRQALTWPPTWSWASAIRAPRLWTSKYFIFLDFSCLVLVWTKTVSSACLRKHQNTFLRSGGWNKLFVSYLPLDWKFWGFMMSSFRLKVVGLKICSGMMI